MQLKVADLQLVAFGSKHCHLKKTTIKIQYCIQTSKIDNLTSVNLVVHSTPYPLFDLLVFFPYKNTQPKQTTTQTNKQTNCPTSVYTLTSCTSSSHLIPFLINHTSPNHLKIICFQQHYT